jgi:hypothetical protein
VKQTLLLGFALVLVASASNAQWADSFSRGCPSCPPPSTPKSPSDESQQSIDAALKASANGAVLSSVISRISTGAQWSEVALTLSGPRTRASALAVMAFTPAASSARIDASVRGRLAEIRNALGIPDGEQRCAPRPKVNIDSSLWEEADRVLKDDEEETRKKLGQRLGDEFLAGSPDVSFSDVTTTAEILALIGRISSNPDHAAFLSRFSKAVFGCWPWRAKVQS